MGKAYPQIPDTLREFIEAQPVYFIASAPLATEGHLNLSPKGLDTFRVLGPNRVAYLDLTGSGNETAAHLAENGRITVMFCAFSGSPRIVRLFGVGRVVLPHEAEWAELRPLFPALPGARQIILIEVRRTQSSCGFGVPTLESPQPRRELVDWAERRGEEALVQYREEKNARSIDGLPAPGLGGRKP